MKEQLNKFKDYLSVNNYRNKMYLNYVKLFLQYLNGQEVTGDNITAFILKIKPDHKIGTTNMYIKAINVYLEFLNKNIKTPKLGTEIIKIHNTISFETLENEVVPIIPDLFIRPLKIKALLYFMFFTGVRPHELYLLKRNDIDFKNKRAKVCATKTSEERFVVYPDIVKDLLELYFISDPEGKNTFNLGTGSLQNIFNTLKSNFPDIKFKPYLLRHSMATHLFKKGVDILSIMKLMGHKSIKTTEIYINTNIDDIQNIYNKKVSPICKERKERKKQRKKRKKI